MKRLKHTFHCSHCGSLNHRSGDCNKPSQTFTPPDDWYEEVDETRPSDRLNQVHGETVDALTGKDQPVFEPNPRWPGAPPICTFSNRMAFASLGLAYDFIERNSPGASVKEVWKCERCGMWHYKCRAKQPSGSTSGTSREDNLPKGFKPFVRPGTYGRPHRPDELPQREASAEEPRKPAAMPARAPERKKPAATTKPSEKELF